MSVSTTFTSNSSTPAPATDVGINISKPGYNALSTAGNNLLYSSTWPTLQYPFQTTIGNPGNLSSQTLKIAHNLKYPPLAFAWFYGPDPSGIGNTAFRIAFPTDGTNVYIDTFSQALTTDQQTFMLSATEINIKCLNVDLSTDIDYTLAPGDTVNTPYDPNYGIKVALPGKDVHSTDIRNFALHSKCQSPLVLAVKTQASSSSKNPTVVQYVSTLSYPSWVYGFIKVGASNFNLPENSYLPAPYYSQAYPETVTDGFTSYIQFNSTDNGASLIILRDPMFAATQTNAQYV